MRKFVLVMLILLVFANPGWTLTMTDVGSLDDLLAMGQLGNYGDDTELTWVDGILESLGEIENDVELALVSKTDTNNGMGWNPIENKPGYYAYDFGLYEPQWFFVKTGKIENQDEQIFLFKNIAELQYGTIYLGALGINTSNIEKVSHIGQVAPVPEPATMLLFGTGLIGLAGVSRKKFKK